jgi:hypothetical protein
MTFGADPVTSRTTLGKPHGMTTKQSGMLSYEVA